MLTQSLEERYERLLAHCILPSDGGYYAFLGFVRGAIDKDYGVEDDPEGNFNWYHTREEAVEALELEIANHNPPEIN